MGELGIRLGVGVLQFAFGAGVAAAFVRLSKTWPLWPRFVLVAGALLALMGFFIWMNRAMDRHFRARRAKAIDDLLDSLGRDGNATLVQAGIRIADGQSRAEVVAWLRTVGVPDAIVDDIYERGYRTAHPPFLRVKPAATLPDRLWPTILLLSACTASFGFVIGSMPLLVSGALGLLGGQELSERAWRRAGHP